MCNGFFFFNLRCTASIARASSFDTVPTEKHAGGILI